jgi:RNA polymerase sigma-70 factor (ECF subfamily)
MSPTSSQEEQVTEVFEEHRATLLGAAYRILGSHADAEDVVQEAWIRWSKVDQTEVQNPRAYLLTTTSRLALNRLREQARRRESYLGPWLPEPVASSTPATEVGTADEVSMAMLIVLESLSPLERAAFVLSEVFGMSGPEVAEALDRTPAAVRQLVHRARSHVQARRPRQVVDRTRHRQITERFMAAAAGGDLDSLIELMAPDVVLVTDGGGIKQAALRPIHGVDKVLRWFAGVMTKPEAAGLKPELRTLNGETAIAVTDEAGELDGVFFLTIADDRITAVHGIRNPEKLRLA